MTGPDSATADPDPATADPDPATADPDPVADPDADADPASLRRVGLVLVSHVAELAVGVRRLAAQMAPDVAIADVGGTDDGGIGTSFDKISDAVASLGSDDAVVLYDLGSALLTAELVAEVHEGVRLVDAPLVEGAVAAAVAAQGGASIDEVARAAESAGGGPATVEASGGAGTITTEGDSGLPPSSQVTETAVLRNPLGLHARPLALLAQAVAGLDAGVTVGRTGGPGIAATNVIALAGLAIVGGESVDITATGPDAQAAVDAVVRLIDEGFGEPTEDAGVPARTEAEAPAGDTGSPAATPVGDADVLQGISASPGIVVGRVHRLRRIVPELDREPAGPATELARLERALDQAAGDLRLRAAGTRTTGAQPTGAQPTNAQPANAQPAEAQPTVDAQIANAHWAFLRDPTLHELAAQAIADGATAEAAWWHAVQQARPGLAAVGRAVDLEDLGVAVLRILDVAIPLLGGALGDDSPPGNGDRVGGALDGAVVVAEDLLPSQVTELVAARAGGVALAGSGPTAHAAIIARGLGLPFVVRLGDRVLDLDDGTEVILDAGTLHHAPTASDLDHARARAAELEAQQARERDDAALPVVVSGRRIHVEANVASLTETQAAIGNGADGIGLLRTELMYLDRPELPTEAGQREQLTEIFALLADLRTTVRTLDIGADKLLPALDLDPVTNGPLGVRGLRYGLAHPQILRTQIRAVLAAARDTRVRLALMAPMVTTADEAGEFRRLVEEARAPGQEVEVGVMIEVPAAALAASDICAQVDFVSVGTNDLAQYLLAADRTLPQVGSLARLYDHPAVWHCIDVLVRAASAAGCRVAVCGELASDPDAAVRLVELGVDELSMAPAAIPRVKRALRGVPRRGAE